MPMLSINACARVARSLPIGWKLALTVAGALGLLTGVAWFALDRLTFVASLQASVTAQADVEHQVQRGLIAAQELRVVSRELPHQQTAAGIRTATERATHQRDQATEIMRGVRDRLTDAADLGLLDQSIGRLDALMAAVTRAGALRGDIITLRQKKLFQVRQVFDTSLNTLRNELTAGTAPASGVDSVRAAATTSGDGNQNDANLAELTRYQLAMGRLQGAALMFMATGNPAAANSIREATQAAQTSMTAIMGGGAADQIKADARIVGSIGAGIAQASADLIDMTKRLDDVAGPEVEQASQAMQAAFEALAETAAQRADAASAIARDATNAAWRHITMIIAATAVLMIGAGGGVTATIAGPIRRLTRIVQAIAAGETGRSVPYTDRGDEVGRMAASVERLRGVMRETFLQSQMIEQMPVGVMTAEPTGDCRITYLNAEACRILETVKESVAVPIDQLVGQSMNVFQALPPQQRAILTDPANLPSHLRLAIGPETMELRVIATHDRQGDYAGPLIIWRRLTGQVKLVDQFEQSVGAIARTIGDSADGMRLAASGMRQSAVDAGERTDAVSAASDEAARNVSAAAAAAEELAASIAEITRQVAEQAHIAAEAVAEAAATDASVGGLSEAADKIGSVVRLIGDIAGQTNLLALNATIEAARAGESGKGFAVVAGEVKNLATQTARATQEIGVQIAAMRQATGQAVGALRSIAATIQRMNEIATGIAGSVEQQGSATQAIAQAVAQAAAGTAEVNGNITVVNQAVGQTGDKAGTVLHAATDLTAQSAVLKAEVERFLAAVQQAA
ncbi:methyl-accepting chemotaxis protein [Rhodopila sp.]|uniref:methyl-accepting chemotaxis protein n=1 Tax=Rhodopila sp. TaxID=2480087 RepID=UPI003D0F3998